MDYKKKYLKYKKKYLAAKRLGGDAPPPLYNNFSREPPPLYDFSIEGVGDPNKPTNLDIENVVSKALVALQKSPEKILINELCLAALGVLNDEIIKGIFNTLDNKEGNLITLFDKKLFEQIQYTVPQESITKFEDIISTLGKEGQRKLVELQQVLGLKKSNKKQAPHPTPQWKGGFVQGIVLISPFILCYCIYCIVKKGEAYFECDSDKNSTSPLPVGACMESSSLVNQGLSDQWFEHNIQILRYRIAKDVIEGNTYEAIQTQLIININKHIISQYSYVSKPPLVEVIRGKVKVVGEDKTFHDWLIKYKVEEKETEETVTALQKFNSGRL